MTDPELADCPPFCSSKEGGDHDHTEPLLIPGWMPYEVIDHPADARYERARFVETWEEDAEGWVVTPVDYMRETV